MANTPRTTLWVTSIRPREIHGETSVATAVAYQDGSNPSIGNDALARQNDQIVNTEFKINLGDIIPGALGRRQQFETETGEKSAYEISQDFISVLLSEVEQHSIDGSAHSPSTKIMVAEPLSFQVEGRSNQWLPNYRGNLRRILSRFDEIDFLPEPFAVYQYYRYGLRVPHLLDRSKQIALILDFGGGTFDACIIESTKDGDVSIRGKHSKPMAAKSVPVGGFYVNRRVALYLVKRSLEGPDRRLADKYFGQYIRVKKGDLSRDVLKPECQHFIRNMERLELSVERHKIELTSRVVNWTLDDEAYERVLVRVPTNVFDSQGPWTDTEFYAHQFRRLFVSEVWNDKLKDVVGGVLRMANDGLAGRPITTTLISGGSSNIRWLEALVSRDFGDLLSRARPVPISHSFQEVVANGLAIECARRFYTDDDDEGSEFTAVTYNPIRLHLGSDGERLVCDYRFRSINDQVDMVEARPGDLIPSAQSLRHFFNQHLQWRVRLKRPPKQFLEYFFRRPGSSEVAGDDSDSFEGVFNLEETRLPTTKRKFDSSILVNLEVREDGTATPKFVYQAENTRGGIRENAEEGRSFFIDMTTHSEVSGKAGDNYVGFDFGTSNSAVCTLSNAQIQMTEIRSTSVDWTNISDSLHALPYPVAIAVRRYLSLPNQAVNAARDAFESGLAMMAYVAAAEACLLGKAGGLLVSFPHRAMSPLWALFNGCLKKLGDKARFSARFGDVLTDESRVASFQEAIEAFTLNKHGKLADEAKDWHTFVQLPLTAILLGMEGFVFGRSMASKPVPFAGGEHEGVFVVANDNQPFVETRAYRSDVSVDGSVALLVDRTNGQSMSLSPFVFWFDRNKAGVHDCYLLDRLSSKGGGPTVKPCDRDEEVYAEDLAPALRTSIEELPGPAEPSRPLGPDIRFAEDEGETGA